MRLHHKSLFLIKYQETYIATYRLLNFLHYLVYFKICNNRTYVFFIGLPVDEKRRSVKVAIAFASPLVLAKCFLEPNATG